MPSTFTTDPIGPRSVDEMLGVVYSRAHGMRRRRLVQRTGVAAIALLVGIAGVVTVRGGDPDAHVRTVDRPTGEKQTSVPVVDPGAVASAMGLPLAPPTTAVPKDTKKARQIDATVHQPDGVPSLPTDNAPPLETWADATDALNDSTPANWYYDIAATVMQFDPSKQVVIFTTSYRAPDVSPDSARDDRAMEATFDYAETGKFTVTVSESGNQLGAVGLEGSPSRCADCTARFDAASAKLVVTVPLATLNADVTGQGFGALGSGADIMSMAAATRPLAANLPVQADTT